MTLILFWIAVAFLVYTFAVFPIIIILRGVLFPKPPFQDDITPSISMIVSAYNEEEYIGEKIKNTLSLDYPADKFEILIGSDGSTDRTAEIIQRFANPQIRFFDLPRSGKNGVLNTIVPKAKGEILIFSDANSMYAPNAIRVLARCFADPQVGGVAGNQTYLPSEKLNANEGERTYWNLDQKLKEYQGRAGNVTSATGAIYAIRAKLFQILPKGMDDFIISTSVIAQGYRLIYARDAISYEPVAASSSFEYKRKVRTIMLGLEAIVEMRQLFNPFKYGFYALQLFTHKVLRRLVFVPLFILLTTSPLLWDQSYLYELTVYIQLAFYSLALIGFFIEKTEMSNSKIFSIPLYFVMVYTASFIATFNFLRGNRIHKWETKRLNTIK